MNILNRLTTSPRGQKYNPLIWPFLISTAAYGFGFAFLGSTTGVHTSSLFQAMTSLAPVIPFIWGIVALLVIVVGIIFLLYRMPPAGKLSGLVGFMVWAMAGMCWLLTGGWLLFFSIAVPNLYFWAWQYLSLTIFHKEYQDDKATMVAYDHGEYDDDNGGKELRESNRGVDPQ